VSGPVSSSIGVAVGELGHRGTGGKEGRKNGIGGRESWEEYV